MIGIKDVTISSKEFSEGLLIESNLLFPWVDGKRMDVATGSNYLVAYPNAKLRKLNIKIEGMAPLIDPEVEIEFGTKAKLTNLVITTWFRDGQVNLSARADNIEIIK